MSAPLFDAGPSTFGLTDEELRRHANDLAAQGWGIDEITERLAITPRRAQTCPCCTHDTAQEAAE